MPNPSTESKTIAAVRIAASIFFLFFGEYKVFGPGFAHGGFQKYLSDYIGSSAVSFYRPVLSGIVLPHAVFFGYAVGVIEAVHRYLTPDRVLGASRLRSRDSISAESDAGLLVGRRPRSSRMALFRRPARHNSAAAVTGDLFRRGRRNRLGARPAGAKLSRQDSLRHFIERHSTMRRMFGALLAVSLTLCGNSARSPKRRDM